MSADRVRNWTEISNKTREGKKIGLDKHYHRHEIKPCKMISFIAPTGGGKSSALVEFLARKNNAFHEIIIFTGSTTDEDLYHFLQDKIDGIQLLDDVDELPELTDYNDCDKDVEKLIVFDDIINLKSKDKLKIQKWFNSARKYGFTCICMAQNYTDLPIQIRRNSHYIFLFRLKDLGQVNQILKQTNNDNLDLGLLREMYREATEDIGQFLKIDTTEGEPRKKYRKNFIGYF